MSTAPTAWLLTILNCQGPLLPRPGTLPTHLHIIRNPDRLWCPYCQPPECFGNSRNPTLKRGGAAHRRPNTNFDRQKTSKACNLSLNVHIIGSIPKSRLHKKVDARFTNTVSWKSPFSSRVTVQSFRAKPPSLKCPEAKGPIESCHPEIRKTQEPEVAKLKCGLGISA